MAYGRKVTMAMREIHLCVPVLARVEGEGALDLQVRNSRIETLRLRIFEPPRLFEKFLEGREYGEVPDLVARICGICPVAYQMTAVQAMESLFGLDPDPWVHAMRRVFYCGEWIQSHALHIHWLAAPDFLGYDSAVDMAATHAEVLRRGLTLQSLGNALVNLLGGRSVHPVGVRVGGFYAAPRTAEVAALWERLVAAVPDAEALVAWTAALPLPCGDQDFVSVALRHPYDYPMNGGRIIASDGLDIPISEYETHFAEYHVAHSTALFSALHDRPYLVGPLARLNLNEDRLYPPVRAALARTGIPFPSRNTFHSIVARAVEIHQALLEVIDLLTDYREPPRPAVSGSPRAGIGFGATEAPRGLLWHRYELDATGVVRNVRLVPPTSQNQARIEEDLRNALEALGVDQDEEVLRKRAEMIIRSYDPCISCATHFLRVRVGRA